MRNVSYIIVSVYIVVILSVGGVIIIIVGIHNYAAPLQDVFSCARPLSTYRFNRPKTLQATVTIICSVLFCSVLFCSVLFCSVLFCSVLFCSVLVWSGLVWSGLVWSGLVWSGLVWSGLVWFRLILVLKKSKRRGCRWNMRWTDINEWTRLKFADSQRVV